MDDSNALDAVVDFAGMVSSVTAFHASLEITSNSFMSLIASS